MNVYEFLSAYLPPPMIGFIFGVSAGFGLGLLFSKGFFVYVTEGRRFKREDREAERQRKENAAKRRLESCKRRKEAEQRAAAEAEAMQKAAEQKAHFQSFLCRKIELGIQEDGVHIFDREDIYYCPECFNDMKLVKMIDYEADELICPVCGKQVPAPASFYYK